jgi:molybdopterin-guanine dinucleotide biosynthesis protein A
LKNKRNDITAFILSGGNSARMEQNKALLRIGGNSLIQRLIGLLDLLFSEIIISTNEPENYDFTKKKIIKDIFPGRGPLGGIHSALQFTSTEKNFFISCDMPFILSSMIEFLCDYKTDALIILPKAEGRIQQLCGLYSKSTLSEIKKLLVESSDKMKSKVKGSIFELIKRVPTDIVDVSKLEYYHRDIFFNMNTPEDYKYVTDKIANK